MVKKMKKYAKFVVCMGLILGLMAPSYAALSASDGSAFVTKAEFDSALADFNARLTTFEAGINSKIDSQVTSYLDRNGIWSGKEQEMLWTSKILGSDDSHKDWAYAFREQWNSMTIVGSNMNFWKYPIVNELNKSGLLYALVTLKLGTGTGMFQMQNIRIGRGSGSANAWEYTVSYGWGLMVERSGVDILLSTTICNTLAGKQPNESQTYFVYNNLGPTLCTSPALIFVNSKDTLNFVTWGIAASGHPSVYMAPESGYPWYTECVIDSLKVY